MIKRLIAVLTAALACLAGSSQAQISIPAGGKGPITFSLPANDPSGDWTSPGQWETVSVAGAGNTYLSPAATETAAKAMSASAINQALGSSTTLPPSANAVARWNGGAANCLFVLQLRPTGNATTYLKATLRNDTGANVSALNVTYDFASQSPAVLETPGLYVYWSLSGSPNTWTKIDIFSGHENSGTYTATLPLGAWGAGEPLYIIWADDNADTATDPSYTIDNISFVPTSGNTVSVSAPVNGASFALGSPITLGASAIMPNPVTSVSWFDNGTLIGSDNSAPYGFTWNTATLGSHTITATATDGASTINSTNIVIISVHPNQPPVISALTNDQNAAQILTGSLLTYTAVATDDGRVTNVEFRVDGTVRWDDPSTPFTFAWCDMTAGTHTLTAIASDDIGAKTTNSVNITVTNGSGWNVLLANGATWKYWDEGVDPGATWKDIGFNDSGWSNGIAEIGYGDRDANRPESTVSRQIVGTPGDPSAITNAAQLFRKTFTVGSLSSLTGLVVRILADDGAVVYINGNEVARLMMPVGQTFTTFANGSADDGATFNDFIIPLNSVQPGENTVAVEVHQSSATSSDVSFDTMIVGITPPAPRLSLTKAADG
ncbi:MAG TPA: Ig-like domain-containing protein, partial [Candidatus Saccharimonadales bacterium]|nr:Ig-like domain-containing protein [Candidatus Saccharimonadales bacterium]